MFILLLVRFGLLSGSLLERDAHSVDHMFSLFFDNKYTNSRKLWIELYRKIIKRYNLIGYSLNVM